MHKCPKTENAPTMRPPEVSQSMQAMMQKKPRKKAYGPIMFQNGRGYRICRFSCVRRRCWVYNRIQVCLRSGRTKKAGRSDSTKARRRREGGKEWERAGHIEGCFISWTASWSLGATRTTSGTSDAVQASAFISCKDRRTPTPSRFQEKKKGGIGELTL